MSNSSRLRVAVIGVGAAGLAALRHLAANPKMFEPKAFEMTPHVSGTWAYSDRIGTDERGLPLHVSMYKNLRTNLPKEVMAFPGFPFTSGRKSFLPHTKVRKYLEDYADHFKLNKYISFNTQVKSISPITEEGSKTWKVLVRDVRASENQTEGHTFDAVIVCNGHYAIPLIPNIPGLSAFQGQVIHSHDYRVPEIFTGKTVAILGAAASGQDICVDIAQCSRKIYLCHRQPNPIKSVLPENVSQTTGIKEVRGDIIILDDDTELQVDVILLCTGYRYDFNFLSDDCKPNVEDERVTPLYKHLIHTKHPTLSFIGVVKKVCPFPLFDCQVRFVLASLTGEMVLPSTEEMDKDTEEDYRKRLSEGIPTRHAHTMGKLQWAYNDELADLGGFERIPKVVRNLYDQVHIIRTRDISTYKNTDYELVSDTEYREL